MSEQFAPKPSTHFHYREERRAILRIVVFCIGLMIALPGAHADASKDCVQKQDLDRQISGCTEIITKGRETKDNLAAAYNNRGYAYGHKGDYDRAIADFSKAIELDPKDAETYFNRGYAYGHKGDYDRAIADFSKALELDPKAVVAYNSRGAAYEHKGDHDRAIADFSKVLELDPKDAHVYHNRGAAYEDKGDHDRAIADYRRALQFDPSIEASKEGLKRLGVSP